MTWRQRQQKQQQLTAALAGEGLQEVHGEFDAEGICYLDGAVHSRDQKGRAVETAYELGADTVIEGLLFEEDRVAEPFERDLAVSPYPHLPRHELKTPAEKILGHADLSSRIFDVVTNRPRTGSHVVTMA